MIRTRDLSCGYGRTVVLHGLDLHVRRGEICGLLGPNGAGKTTLLKTLAGILRPRAGSVAIDGHDPHGLRARNRARLVASVPQQAEVPFPLTCLTVALMGRYARLPRFSLGGYDRRDRRATLAAMQATGCAHLAQRPADSVSGGELQRVLIARALAQETNVLLLDEPAASLDLAGTVALFDLLRERTQNGDGVILCALHDINLAALYCDRLVFLKDGEIAAQGPTDEVFTQANLERVYDTPVRVAPHPAPQAAGAPQAHFVPARPRTPGGRSST